MVSEHDNRKDQKEFFLKGYREMLKRIEPERIIRYNTPFPEMEGNIVFVDYGLSSWRYQKDTEEPSPYLKYICGALPLPENSGIIIKRGYVEKGMGSAYGGKWRPNPNKPEDKRYLGNPGEVKQTTMRNGEQYETKIGRDGRAEMERHHTDHGKPWAHTNPHDHVIEWIDSPGYPNPQSPINYPGEIPEFKRYIRKAEADMTDVSSQHFETLSEFKFCMKCHGEVLFDWKDKRYSITHYAGKISISEVYNQDTEMLYDTCDDVLSYPIGDGTLRDIIRQVDVISRSI